CIRNFHVTGVQTCALPIYLRKLRRQPQLARPCVVKCLVKTRKGAVAGLVIRIQIFLLKPKTALQTAVYRAGKIGLGITDACAIRSEERRVGKVSSYRSTAR